ncbi:hypothetical protein SNE40_008390 [Patella caerulea]|uniref:Cytochrome P450 n=1 Tax=Patella caerulea TaxID=87958 RepID=A0AAN8K6K7_PATCE
MASAQDEPKKPLPPGSSVGRLLGFLSDKSYDFYKNPVQFFEKNAVDFKSRIFQSRFLLKPTVFVGSNHGLADVLSDGGEFTELGYKTFMGQIYGDNILFTDGKPAEELRDALSQLFTDDCVKTYQQTIDRIVEKEILNLDISKPVCLYEFYKKMVTEICLSLFLGLDFEDTSDVYDTITSLTTTHWHGIISVPLALKIPGTGKESTFKQALQAKDKLLEVIKERRGTSKKGFHQKLEEIHELDEEAINNHLLLFTSALVPKALASLLTSFSLEVGQHNKVSWQKMCLLDEEFMDQMLLEVQRYYPPFLGGRRVVTKNFEVDGYTIPAGHAIVYLTFAAHRDPSIFENPNQFYPGRWKNSTSDTQKKLFCFGYLSRGCVGERLVWAIIKTILTSLLKKFELSLVDNQDLSYKWLPVSRPKTDVLFKFTTRPP